MKPDKPAADRLSRREALGALAGLPLLPLAAAARAAGLLAACTGGAGRGARRVTALRFDGMAAPAWPDAAAMATTTVRSSLVATFGDGTTQTYALGYRPLFITGAAVPDGRGGTLTAGACHDIHGRPIIDRSGEAPRPFFSDCPDGSSLLTLDRPAVPGVAGHTVFAVVQFEYTSRDRAGSRRHGNLPSPIAVLTLDQEPATGALSLVKYHAVDTRGVHGLWTTCGASLSPWGTHLSSEEFEPDAARIGGNPWFESFSRHLYGDPAAANPYHYGHVPEVTVLPDGSGSIRKHYCLGRISHEVVQVMPDQRTVLMGDDTTNGGLFMFVADRPRDLAAGTLYVARWALADTTRGGRGALRWIRLGHATSAAVEALADALAARDIVDVRDRDPADPRYTAIPFGGRTEWVRFVPQRELAAAFLETHRYAAYKGASMVFTKMEGTTVNAADKVAYSAISGIRGAMKSGAGLDRAIEAGAVYAMNLKGGQADTSGQPIDSDWVPIDLGAIAELTGEDLAAPDALGNTAAVDRIANPDNLKFSDKLRTLFIGEDSGMHVNNFLWAWQVDTSTLTRILSCPAGAESTGLHAADDVNGFAYVLSNFQHAGSLAREVPAEVKAALLPLLDANYDRRYGAAVGYLTGLPAGDASPG